jgi:two-component system KDP operon response regulator KdpE
MNPPSRYRVLLVEDNDLNRTLVRTILTRSAEPIAQAITLLEAAHLASVRAELTASPIDLILLDMKLPDGHGLSLAEELATTPEPKRPVIIALTASVLPHGQDKARATGCDGFLGKPYQPRQLIDVLAAHLQSQ